MAYKIAVATTDGVSVDLHFGQTETFYIYEIEEKDGRAVLLEKRTVSEKPDADKGSISKEPGCGCMGGQESYVKLAAELLKDCSYLLTKRIGRKPYKILEENGIRSLEAPYTLEEAVPKLNAYYIKQQKGAGVKEI